MKSHSTKFIHRSHAASLGPASPSSLSATRSQPAAHPIRPLMAAQAFSSAKDGLAGDADSLAGTVLRRLILTEADLPEGIQFLPSLFRLMAFLLFLPVSVLTAVRATFSPGPARSPARAVPDLFVVPPRVGVWPCSPVCTLTDPAGLVAQVDLVGWIFFKAVLRPLGYASTYVVR